MDIATFRDIIIIIYGILGIVLGILGIVLLIALGVLAFFLYGKVSSILDDVKSIMNKVKTISSYASREIIEPLIGISVAIGSAAEGIRQVRRMFTGKGVNK